MELINLEEYHSINKHRMQSLKQDKRRGLETEIDREYIKISSFANYKQFLGYALMMLVLGYIKFHPSKKNMIDQSSYCTTNHSEEKQGRSP